MALDQHAGRGRQGRTWVSAPGNFYVSTLVRVRTGDPAPQTLSLAAGLALIEAVEVAVPDPLLLLKWPNDLLLSGRKLAGILLERSGDRIAAGFGVNLAAAPQLTDREGASLNSKVVPQAFAPLLAASFSRLLQLWRESPSAMLAQAWLARAHPVGSSLTVHSGSGETVSGTFDGIDPDGALRLRRDDGGLDTIRAGDVQL